MEKKREREQNTFAEKKDGKQGEKTHYFLFPLLSLFPTPPTGEVRGHPRRGGRRGHRHGLRRRRPHPRQARLGFFSQSLSSLLSMEFLVKNHFFRLGFEGWRGKRREKTRGTSDREEEEPAFRRWEKPPFFEAIDRTERKTPIRKERKKKNLEGKREESWRKRGRKVERCSCPLPLLNLAFFL